MNNFINITGSTLNIYTVGGKLLASVEPDQNYGMLEDQDTPSEREYDVMLRDDDTNYEVRIYEPRRFSPLEVEEALPPYDSNKVVVITAFLAQLVRECGLSHRDDLAVRSGVCRKGSVIVGTTAFEWVFPAYGGDDDDE